MSLKTVSALGIVTVVSHPSLPCCSSGGNSSERAQALIALYDSTDGDNWSSQANWRKSPGVFNDAGTECTWFGVPVMPVRQL